MESKFCNACKTTKNIDEFYKTVSCCKKCHCEKQAIRRNSAKGLEWQINYREKTREEHNKKSNERYHSLSPEAKKERNKNNILNLKPLTPEKIEEKRLKAIQYEAKNKEKRRIQRAITRKKRYWQDITYRLEILLRTRFYKAVKRGKVKSAKSLVGCTSEELRDYLVSLWKPEMNWENFGDIWQIDHIIPIDSFDLFNVEEQEKCFHYTNLQPLFRTTEIAKNLGYNEIGNQNKKNKIILK